MNRTSWNRILTKYENSIGPGTNVSVIFKTARDQVSGTVKEIDDNFLVRGLDSGQGVAAIIVLEEVAGFRIMQNVLPHNQSRRMAIRAIAELRICDKDFLRVSTTIVVHCSHEIPRQNLPCHHSHASHPAYG
jgi:hypothetical protein